MTKKNAFLMYVESRRHEFPGHPLAELVGLCSKGWEALPVDQKKIFDEQAKRHNERRKCDGEGQRRNIAPGSSTAKILQHKTIDPYALTDGDKLRFQANQEVLSGMFGNPDWVRKPIVICSFTMYVEPGFDNLFMPAEIGLTAMTLNDGVIDNFARIIDPGQIPKGHGIEAVKTAEKLGLPNLGTVKELADYEPLMSNLQSFLLKNNFRGSMGKELYLFAFDSDFVMVSRCLEWLYKMTRTWLPIKVLSLNYYAWKASLQGDAREASKESETLGMTSGVERKSSLRETGKSLIGNFIYSPNHPNCATGVFNDKEEVDECIKGVDNYKYFEELCCVYHMKSGKEIQYCALNMSNRFAFSILEILTLSNPVTIIAGGHYPEIDKPNIEMRRRYFMLGKWGITDFEENLEVWNDAVKPVGARAEWAYADRRDGGHQRGTWRRMHEDKASGSSEHLTRPTNIGRPKEPRKCQARARIELDDVVAARRRLEQWWDYNIPEDDGENDS